MILNLIVHLIEAKELDRCAIFFDILKADRFEVKVRLSSSVLQVMTFIIALKNNETPLSGSGNS